MYICVYVCRDSFRKLSGGRETGDMIVKNVTVSQTPSGEGEGICLNMCVCRVSYRILSFGRGNSQISVLMWRGCIAHNN